MRITLVGKKYIIKDKLPNTIIDNYWLVDKNTEKKILNIKKNKKKWEIESDNNVKVINPNCIKISDENITFLPMKESILNKVTLEPNNIYAISFGSLRNIFILYCSPVYEKDFIYLNINKTVKEFTIGYDDNNDIIYENALLSDCHAKIFKENGKWIIENLDRKYGVFVNNYPVFDKQKSIFNGDIIFIMGLKIVIMKDSIFIVNPNENIKINKNTFSKNNLLETTLENFDSKLVEDAEINLTEKKDYYSKSPRIENNITNEKIKIDEPPQPEENIQKPLLLVIGSTVLFGIFSLSYITNVIKDISSGLSSKIEIFIDIIASIAMIASMLIIPLIEIKWEKKFSKISENKRQKKYKEYLIKKKEIIEKISNEQKEILYNNYLSADECVDIIFKKNHRLWERNRDDFDFLTVRLGTGKVPLHIEMSYPEEKFELVEDSLVDELNELIDSAQYIEEAPVTISFIKNNVSSIISKDNEFVKKFIKTIILQLITFHSYEDLKLVFFITKTNSKDWQYVKMLPHVLDNNKKIRFFADDYNEINEVSKYLMEELNNRKNSEEKNPIFTPYYLIITDDYKQIESLDFFTKIKEQNTNLGFSILCIADDLFKLPNHCNAFFNINTSKEGILLYKEKNQKEETKINIEPLSTFYFEKITQKLANIPIRLNSNGTNTLPEHYTFLEMYNVGNVEQLNIMERWKKNDSTLSLGVPIGIDGNGILISLDIHEKQHGPHGLVAGFTGSGKSEFLITYILSLAVNFHPDDIAFLLIDYKGGGLAGAFQKNNIKLPHLVGTITNIEKNGLQRSLISIRSELKRRQIIFNEARNIINGSTMDIYKYQNLYHRGIVKKTIPHLFIICDEFAELKQQQEDFMNELISVSRIGRSLGVHLILATQKPSGIVDDQIISNSKFAICLKVQDINDSRDVINTPDAAYLKKAGQFYLRVGQDEYFTLGQSAWSGAPYIPSNTMKKNIDCSIEIINNIGYSIKEIEDNKQKKTKEQEDQLTNILNQISAIAKNENIKTDRLWLDEISENVFVKDLRKKYGFITEKYKLEVVIGEYDDPANQKQGLVTLNLMKQDNIIIFGNAKSGKETLLSTMIYDLITEYTVEQINIYILDFGSESLKIFNKSPHIGDTIFMGEDEKVDRFYEFLKDEIKKRKEILSKYNGNYNLYISNGNEMPLMLIIINNYDTYSEAFEDRYEELFLFVTRDCLQCGIMFVVTASSTSAMRYRLSNNFNKIILLQLNNEDEYDIIFDNIERKRPSNIFGRGLIKMENDEILEFQTAKICETKQYIECINSTIERLKNENIIKAKPLPSLPEVVKIEDLKTDLIDISRVPIGIIKNNLKVFTYNFIENFITIIVSKNGDLAKKLIYNICELVKEITNIIIQIIDFNKVKGNVEKEFRTFISQIKKGIKHNDKITLCSIIGIDQFAKEVDFDEIEFYQILEKSKESGKYCFIIEDKPNRLEDHKYDNWYENFLGEENGFWIGKGIENQNLLSLDLDSDNIDNNCENSLGYYIKDGNTILIKFVGLKDEGEDK